MKFKYYILFSVVIIFLNFSETENKPALARKSSDHKTEHLNKHEKGSLGESDSLGNSGSGEIPSRELAPTDLPTVEPKRFGK